MPPKRKYKQWLRDGNVPIPKRTLVRLKKAAASNYCTIRDESLLAEDRTITEQSELNQDITWEISGNCEAILNDQTVQTPTREVTTQTSLISYDNEWSEDEIEAPNRIQCDDVSLTDLCHLQEDCDYRDIDSDEASYRCESESEDSDFEENGNNTNAPKQLYPGASITIEDSILSIMKYALRHKTSYSALTDLLSLITLHLPTESYTEHLQSLYFLKKAFSSQSEYYGHEQSDIVTVHEYCPDCLALWLDNERICRFCDKERKRKTNNYFLTLDIGAQLKSLFKGKSKL